MLNQIKFEFEIRNRCPVSVNGDGDLAGFLFGSGNPDPDAMDSWIQDSVIVMDS